MRWLWALAIAMGCDGIFHVDNVVVVDAMRDAPPPPDMMIDAPPPFTGARRVFVTSATHDGNFSGLMGADNLCAGLATAAMVNGTFRAWMSDSSTDAVARLRPGGVPIVLLNGVQVAASWDALLQDAIDAPIEVTEKLGTTSSTGCDTVTNTQPNGMRLQIDPSLTCGDWTTSTTGTLNAIGVSHATTMNWTEDTSCGGRCSGPLHIYCFEN